MAGKTERSRICLAGKDPDDRCVRVISTGSTADVIGNSDLGGGFTTAGKNLRKGVVS